MALHRPVELFFGSRFRLAGRRTEPLGLAEKWPDQSTRELLAQRALQDKDPGPRSAALQALAEKWPDQPSSEFGRILLTRDLDGVGPYLDPLEPISHEHIKKAAAKAGIRPDDIDAQVASLSAHLGWDVALGAKKKTVKKTGRHKPGRKRRN